MIITIDGPAGSGKSTVAKVLAQKLNIYYLNTGLLYRAVAYIWLKNDPNLERIDSANTKSFFFISKIICKYVDKSQNIFYEDKNITSFLLKNTISQVASILSIKKEVRDELLSLQRNISKQYDIVADGRDCGSVVFPDADYKFYLTASLDIRAKRIFNDKRRDNQNLTYEEVKLELEQRDNRDRTRSIAPLIIPKNAIIINNSDLDENQTIMAFLLKIKS